MRVKGSSASRNKHKKLYSITKGFWGRKKNVYRRAREAYLHALTSAFAGRKNRKRDFRKMWINRKMLADLAVNDAPAFAQLVEKARAAL